MDRIDLEAMPTQPPLVAPFRGERFASSARLTSLIAPPYDVISPDRRAELAERDPHNIVHLILPEGRDRYRKAAKLLHTWRTDDSLIRDERESIYVVQQEFTIPDGTTWVRTGVIAGYSVKLAEAWVGQADLVRVRGHLATRSQ